MLTSGALQFSRIYRTVERKWHAVSLNFKEIIIPRDVRERWRWANNNSAEAARRISYASERVYGRDGREREGNFSCEWPG